MDWNQILNTVTAWATSAGLRLLFSLILLFISFKIINLISRRIERSGDKGKTDKTIARVFAYMFRIGLKLVIVTCLVGYVGIDTSGLAALVASLGVGVGLAVNGTLANLAGGVLIILSRPFRVDDFIETQGFLGTVEDIHITYTCLRTPDYKMVYLPNGALSAATIVNYSRKDMRRVEFALSVEHTTDIQQATAVLTEVLSSHELVLPEPDIMVKVVGLTERAIDFTARCWVRNTDYWTVYYDMLERVKAAFDANGIHIPHQQMDIHIKNDKA